MKHFFKMLSAVLVAAVLLQGCPSAKTGGPDEEFFNRLMRVSVEVLVNGKMSGSGSFVSADGYVLTAAHFITSPDMKFEVLSTSLGRHDAKLIGIDKSCDIALLKIETENELEFLTVSEQPPQMGQAIYVIGAPLNKHALALNATVASKGTEYEYLNDQESYINIWYIQAMTPRGLSGGNWVNSNGQIVGVQSGFLNEQITGADGNVNSGIAFMADIKAISRLIKTKEYAQTPTIGGIIEELWTQESGFQERFETGAEGIIIHQVHSPSPLEKAGLVHEDMIVEADGKKVRYRRELLEIIRSKKVGDKLEITFVKPDGKEGGKKEVTLGSLEEKWLGSSTEDQSDTQ